MNFSFFKQFFVVIINSLKCFLFFSAGPIRTNLHEQVRELLAAKLALIRAEGLRVDLENMYMEEALSILERRQ